MVDEKALRLVIADDEHIIIKGIKDIIDWGELGVDIVGTALDGRALLDLIIEQKPHIVLSDICMPKMTGIDVLKEVKKRKIEVDFIFISAYQEFEFAREGMKLGAVDYLIKPIDEIALKNLVLSLKKKHSTPKSVFDKNALELSENNEQDYCVLALKCFDTKQMQRAYQYLAELNENFHVSKYHGTICVIFPVESSENINVIQHKSEVLLNSMNEELNLPVVGGLGGIYKGTGNIATSFQEAAAALEYSYFFDDNRVYKKSDIKLFQKKEDVSLGELLPELVESIKNLNEKSAQGYIDAIIDLIRCESRGVKDIAVMKLFSVVEHIRHISHPAGVDKFYDSDDVLDCLKVSESYTDAACYLKDMISLFINNAMVGSKEEIEAVAVRRIKDYIEANLSENIKLNTVANMMFMNSYYLSVFFKKHTGINFKDYVMNLKMNKALYYLKNTDMKIYEIADAIGFCDQKHFSKVYKKYFGESAIETRKKSRKSSE